MTGAFSLTEKLAVAGAFCALVAMAVGTEEDPGVIAAREAEARRVAVEVRPEKSDGSDRSYWSLTDDTPAEPVGQRPPDPEPDEDLPPGFGAAPSSEELM